MILLHIGPHKTGTTALQELLAQRQEALLKAGWSFETFPDIPDGAHGIADALSTGKPSAIRAALSAWTPAAPNVVISSENFSRLTSEQAKEFLSLLPTDDIRIVFYLRNPLERLESTWREWVKHGYRFSFGEFIAGRLLNPMTDREINEAHKIAAWARHLGPDKVDIHLYETVPDVAVHFTRSYLKGALSAADIPSVRVNATQGPERAELHRALTGYQVWLMENPTYNADLRRMTAALKARCAAQPQLYRKTIELSFDNPFLRRVERRLVERYGARMTPRPEGDVLFGARSHSWTYVAPEIWLAEPDLTQQLFALRQRIHDAFGPPRLDVRMQRL